VRPERRRAAPPDRPREHGREGLLEFTQVKHIHVDQGVPRRERYSWDVLLG
jgi:hypothetical protein